MNCTVVQSFACALFTGVCVLVGWSVCVCAHTKKLFTEIDVLDRNMCHI